MHIDFANLNNLTALWQRYQARSESTADGLQMFHNVQWPHKHWVEPSATIDATDDAWLATQVPDADAFACWPTFDASGSVAINADTLRDRLLSTGDWQPRLTHTAMALNLDEYQANIASKPRHRAGVETMDESSLEAWCETGSQAFGYTIDRDIVRTLIDDSDCNFLLARNNAGDAVATGMLFCTGAFAGIHQIGVPAEYQGQGFASVMMRALLQLALDKRARHAVLQASAAGKPVYEKLGFEGLFDIHYLQRSAHSKNNNSA